MSRNAVGVLHDRSIVYAARTLAAAYTGSVNDVILLAAPNAAYSTAWSLDSVDNEYIGAPTVVAADGSTWLLKRRGSYLVTVTTGQQNAGFGALQISAYLDKTDSLTADVDTALGSDIIFTVETDSARAGFSFSAGFFVTKEQEAVGGAVLRFQYSDDNNAPSNIAETTVRIEVVRVCDAV